MKYVVYFVIGWCVLLAGTGEAMADVDGNELLNHCHDYTEKSDFGAGFCIGYVTGIAEALNHKVNLPTPFCMPSEVVFKQMVLIITKYLNGNPAELHKTATSLIQAALVLEFLEKYGTVPEAMPPEPEAWPGDGEWAVVNPLR